MIRSLFLTALYAAAPHPLDLKGTPVTLETPPRALVSAEQSAITQALTESGWDVHPVGHGLEATKKDRAVRFTERAERPLELSLWTVDGTGATAAIGVVSQGIARVRRVHAGAATLPWIELRVPPGASSTLPGPSLPPPTPVSADIVTRVPNAGKRIALTFDACSTFEPSRYDPAVIAALEAAKAHATLFIGGRWAESHVDLVKQFAANPLFELGNHTYVHPHMPAMSTDRQRDELLYTQRVLFGITGKAPRFFRPPFGEVDAKVAHVAATVGLRTIQFDLPSGDPDPKFTAERLTKWVLKQATSGSIVVMHMNGNGHHTAEALPAIISGLRARGFELVQVGELVPPEKPLPAAASTPR